MNSPLLEALLKRNGITPELAEWADRFPTPQVQREALERYRQETAKAKSQIEAELMPHPSWAKSLLSMVFAVFCVVGFIYKVYHDVVSWTMKPPRITDYYYVDGHRASLTWTPAKEGYTYRIYRVRDAWWRSNQLLNREPWKETSAILTLAPEGQSKSDVYVTAVSPDGDSESRPSNWVSLDVSAS